MMLKAILLLLCTAVTALAGSLGINQGKISISSADGISDASYTLIEPNLLPEPISLSDTSTLRFTFTVIDTSTGNGVFPQQAHLLFEDPNGRHDVTLPIIVKGNGKASFIINASKLHPALAHTHGPLHLTLLLSSLSAHTPLSYPLGELTLPSSILESPPRERHDLPPRDGEPAFQPEQELFHTFREDEKTVGVVKSLMGTGLALSPWAVLAFLLGKTYPSLEMKAARTSSYLFLACLTALEALILMYWVRLKLYQFLPYFLALSLVSAYTGKVALGGLRAARLRSGGAP
ncbi:MAG: hypothetical protein TREMPRED_005636 [Tremellales sp. Tagirdzhanova-0007]|nr:MAG: hypothetical protein TREMPRED_005636 [Tremellales sp. Tagirdzhanova-0007]